MCAVSDHNLKVWEYYDVQWLYRSLISVLLGWKLNDYYV